MVALNFFDPGRDDEGAVPLVRYVQDRDLWLFKLRASRNLNFVIFSRSEY